jgi:SAM domain (Sterile alpha motif)
LRLLIVVGACGAFVAVLRNHAEIVLAHANRESPKSATLPFAQCSHSLGRRRLARKRFVRPEQPEWRAQEITDWFTRLGLPEYAGAFAENGIDVSMSRRTAGAPSNLPSALSCRSSGGLAVY